MSSEAYTDLHSAEQRTSTLIHAEESVSCPRRAGPIALRCVTHTHADGAGRQLTPQRQLHNNGFDKSERTLRWAGRDVSKAVLQFPDEVTALLVGVACLPLRRGDVYPRGPLIAIDLFTIRVSVTTVVVVSERRAESTTVWDHSVIPQGIVLSQLFFMFCNRCTKAIEALGSVLYRK